MRKPMQRFLFFHNTLLKVLLRVLGSAMTIVPIGFLRFHLAIFLTFVCLFNVIGSALLVWWVYNDSLERIQKLEFFRLYANMNSLYDKAHSPHTADEPPHNDQQLTSSDMDTDTHNHTDFASSAIGVRWGSKPRYIPKSVLEVGRFAFDTPFWGLLVPCLFELVSMVLFGMACVVRIIYAFVSPSSDWLGLIFLAPMPFYIACLSFILSLLFRPFDIMSAIQLNDKIIIFNQHGIVLHNRCMEQFERDIQYGGSFVEHWEPCTLQNRAVVIFDHIKDISLALSLENAPFSTQPITLPWLFINTLNNIGKEYRVVLPIVPPHPALRASSSFFKGLVHHLIRHWTFFNIAPVYDSLTIHETIEFLRALQQRRPDLFDKCDFLVSEIENRVSAMGWVHDPRR